MAGSARIRITKTANGGMLAAQLVGPVRNVTAAVARRMVRLVPKKTFRLQDSIEDHGAEVKGSAVVGTVSFGGKVVRGINVDYGLMVERGTSKMAAQPFARPAVLQISQSDLTAKGGKK